MPASPPYAISADPLGVLVAFGAGILSFLSPCVLPLVPGYVSMVSGLSAAELEAGRQTARRPRPPLGPRAPRGIGLFVAGFTVVFVALGAAASGLGPSLLGAAPGARWPTCSALVIVVLGVVVLLVALPARVWARARGRPPGVGSADRRAPLRRAPVSALGAWAAPVMGMAFAFAWTPCIGPGPRRGPRAGRHPVTPGRRRAAAVRLLARPGGALPGHRPGLRPAHLAASPGPAGACGSSTWWPGGVLVAFGVLLLTDNLGWLSAQFSGPVLNHLGPATGLDRAAEAAGRPRLEPRPAGPP